MQLRMIDDGVVVEEEITARDAAIRESISLALEKYDVKKIISYHSTINRAETFTSDVLKDAMSGYEKLHISSNMTGKQRHEVMERFRKAKRAIITNARCLTEGIDVPAADMVLFADPKYSEIDTVQAVGRVMRVSKGKITGYIFLPLFLDQKSEESIAETLSRNRYETVWNVLNAISSMDKDFESRMASSRRSLGGDEPPIPPGIIDILTQPGVDAQKIKDSVGIFIVRHMSDTWEERYGELLRFKQEHGHIAVPYHTFMNRWLLTQRTRWKILKPERH
jgi:superfamily II DNA or RNA helicase